ncbi:hypothetical protein M5K25_007116 [Dendrobium thyrsiflorum]|uniref:Uncharacterized protein n=1 Tax=Dendrobium thyrsiflorum TaxID=117978 RepID=A0ABD0VED1_DENTH
MKMPPLKTQLELVVVCGFQLIHGYGYDGGLYDKGNGLEVERLRGSCCGLGYFKNKVIFQEENLPLKHEKRFQTAPQASSQKNSHEPISHQKVLKVSGIGMGDLKKIWTFCLSMTWKVLLCIPKLALVPALEDASLKLRRTSTVKNTKESKSEGEKEREIVKEKVEEGELFTVDVRRRICARQEEEEEEERGVCELPFRRQRTRK